MDAPAVRGMPMRGQDGVDEAAIDLGEVSWDYETLADRARPGWLRRVPLGAVVVIAALGLLSGSGPATVPALAELLWSSASSIPGLAVSPSGILVGEPGGIVARDPRTGHELWRAPVQGDIAYVDSAVAGLVVAFSYLPSSDGSPTRLTVIEGRTGETLAELSGPGTDGQSPIGRNGDLLLLQRDSPRRDFYDPCPRDVCTVLTAVDLRDGTRAWSYESRRPEQLLVSTVDGQVVAVAFVGREGRVTLIDPTDGSVQSVLEVGPVELGMAALAAGNVITLGSSSGQAVVTAYGVRSRALAWQTTIESPGGLGHVFPCDERVCVRHESGYAVLDGRTGRVVDNQPTAFQEGLGFGMRLNSGVGVFLAEPDGYTTDRGTVIVVTDPGGRVLRRVDRGLPVSSEQWTESAVVLRSGTQGVDLLRVDGAGEIRWLGQLPAAIQWCEAHGELLTCWSEDEPATGMATNGRVWVWQLPMSS